jgi:hypothetical protein
MPKTGLSEPNMTETVAQLRNGICATVSRFITMRYQHFRNG